MGEGISLKETSENFVSLIVEGHALFNKKGNDIICGAVSTLSQTLVKAISAVGKITQYWEQKEGYLSTRIDLKELNEEKKNSNNLTELLFDWNY